MLAFLPVRASGVALVGLAVAALVLALAAPARAAATTFTVDTTVWANDANPGDGVCDTGAGACSLKAALRESNALPGEDRIEFNIPGPAPHVITLSGNPAENPIITDPVVIDATTQPGFGGCPDGANIAVWGNQNGTSTFRVRAPDTTIRGLLFIHTHPSYWVVDLQAGADRTRVTCDVFGGPNATEGDPGGGSDDDIGGGVNVMTNDNVIGGDSAADGNVFRSKRIPINIVGSGNIVSGNTIVGASHPEIGLGVMVYGDNNTIGGVAVGAGNTFSGVNSASVSVNPSATGTAILGNRIDGSDGATTGPGLGIDLLEVGPPNDQVFGVTLNDAGDADAGANGLQNFPELVSASSGGGSTTVAGSLSSEASETYRLEFFSSPACDPSGHGEGAVFLGASYETTDAVGEASFDVDLPVGVAAGAAVTATATDEANNTSEFSACATVVETSSDADSDGVDDSIDTGAGAFDDGSGTSGSIVDSAGLDVHVEDAAASGDGVLVTVGPGSGKATISACGIPSIKLSPGEYVITCGSVIVQVVHGSAEISLDGGLTIVSIPSGAKAEVSDTANGALIENVVGGNVTVTVDGVSSVVTPGSPPRALNSWNFTGFDNPVDNSTPITIVLNSVKAGRAIPLKWKLATVSGAAVTSLTNAVITVENFQCGLASTTDEIEQTAAGESGLQNLGSGRYQLNWKTNTAWAGSCKLMHLDFGDGIKHDAYFKFAK